MSEQDAYVAGLVDGEGWVGFNLWAETGRGGGVVAVRMAKNAERLIEWLAAEYGGRVHHEPAGSRANWPSHVWRVSGYECVPVLRRLRPFLRVKDRQADAVLGFYAGATRYGRWTPEKRAAAEEARALLSQLNGAA